MPTAVFVVDDSADLRAVLVALLEDEGYTVLQAANGQQALNRLRQHPAGLVVLLDLHMPLVSGFEVLRTVDANPALSRRHAYIVLSSAQADELSPEVLDLLERHGIPLVSKAGDPNELVAAVAAAAQRLAAQRLADATRR